MMEQSKSPTADSMNVETFFIVVNKRGFLLSKPVLPVPFC